MQKHQGMQSVGLAATAALGLALAAPARADWIQTAAGTYDYLSATNWYNGTIDDNFPSTLTLLGAQTGTLGSNYTTAGDMNFSYAGNYGFTLRGSGADRTLTLGGNVTLATTGGSSANVIFGSATAGQRLNVDLGGAARTFAISASRTLTLTNTVSNGSVVKTGAGTLNISGPAIYTGSTTVTGGTLILTNSANTFTGDIVASGSTTILKMGEQNSNYDSILGNAANTLSLLNGAKLQFGANNDKAHVLLNPLRTITISGGAKFGTPYGSANANIPGAIVGTGGLNTGVVTTQLSGNNTFTGGLSFSGMVRASSDANLGGSTSALTQVSMFTTNGFSILGTGLNNFSGHTFTWANNINLNLDIQDPDNVFTWDKNYSVGVNSGSDTAFVKGGLGTLVMTASQSYANGSGISTALTGGVLKVDYTAGGAISSGSTNQRLSFSGGTLYLLGKADGSVTQTMSDVRLDAGGGAIVVDNHDGSGTTQLNLGNFTGFAVPAAGSSLNLRTINAGTGAAVITSTAVNDATGVIGAGRVVYNGGDWASITSGTTVGAYAGYTAGLPAAGASGTVNYSHTDNGAVTAGESVNSLKLMTSQAGQSLTISAGQALTLNNGGLLFTGSNDYAVTGGILNPGTTRINTTSGQDLVINQYGTGALTIGAVIANAATTSQNGTTVTGTAVVTGLDTANLYVGMPVTITGGATTTIKSIDSSSQITLNANAGVTGTPVINFASVNALTIAGTGKVILTSSNTYTGQTYVNGATLSISNNNQLNGGANTQLNLSNGTLQATETISTGRAVALLGGGGSFDVANGKTLTLSGVVSGGRLTLNNSDGGNGTLVLGGANTFASGVAINSGVLKLSNNSALHAQGFNTLSFGSGSVATLQINGARSVTVASLTSASANAVVENGATGAAALNVYNGADNTYAGTLRNGAAGTLALTKGGAGTLTLSGSNSYTAGTMVAGGSLKAGNGNAFGTGAITVAIGTLDLRDYNVANTINITGTGASVLLPTSTGALATSFAAGSRFGGWQRSSGATTANLLSGTASALRTVTSAWTNDSHGSGNVVSDVIDLNGTGADVFVLQLTYANSAFNDANAMLGYWKDNTSWVNAIYGGSYSGDGLFVEGAYNGSLALGTWGRDAESNTVWAVVDHNSEFAVVVPEPAMLALLAIGSLALLRRRKI